MNKQLLIDNEKLQFFKNSADFIDSNTHKVIEQGVRGWLVPVYRRYFEQYLSGDAEMHLHIGWLDKRTIGKSDLAKVGREDKRNYCIILEKVRPSIQDTMVLDRFIKAANSETESAIFPATTDGDKLTVLISVFETANLSETYRVQEVSELIRLQLYDDCPSLRVQSLSGGLKVFPRVGLIDHELSVFIFGEDAVKEDWETCVSSALFGNTGNNDIIKCTSQVMYEITEHNGNHRVRLLSDMEASPDFILAIRQLDTRELVRIAACVPSGFFLDVYHVLLCPLELEPPISIHDMLQYPYGEEYGRKETKDSKGTRDTLLMFLFYHYCTLRQLNNLGSSLQRGAEAPLSFSSPSPLRRGGHRG